MDSEIEKYYRKIIDEVGDSPRPGWIYILRETESKRFSVIGRAKHLKPRLDWYGKVLPYDLELMGALWADDYVLREAEAHERFADKNIRGEWFALDEKDIEFLFWRRSFIDPESLMLLMDEE